MKRTFPLLPAIFAFTSFLRAATVITYPVPTNLENIAVSAAGDLFVTSADAGLVYKVSPAGVSQTFGATPDYAAGLAFDTNGDLIVVSGNSLFRFSPDGTRSFVATIPGAQDLNGLALLSPGMVLVADDAAATVWQVNLKTGSSHAWLAGGLLEPNNEGLPIGPNGIKLFGGNAYITNTGAGTIIRVPIQPDGSAGSPSVYASGLGLDDFAIASDGSLFLATQVLNSVIRLFPDGTQSVIATGADGLLGDSSLAFGRTAADSKSMYVVSNGGIYEDLPGGQQPATIVRLDVGITGAIPELQATPEPSTAGLLCAGIGAATMLLCFRRIRQRRA